MCPLMKEGSVPYKIAKGITSVSDEDFGASYHFARNTGDGGKC